MSNKPMVIGVIPSRYASQRLPAKPLIDLLGKTMVQRVYERVQKARLIDRVVVATDDHRIESVVRNFGGEVIVTSPDIKSGSDRVAIAASNVKGDIFVNIQGDEPLIAPEMIDQAVRLLLEDASVPVGTLVKKITAQEDLMNPNVVKVVLDHHMYALYFSRSPIPHIRDDADTAKWLKKHLFFKHVGLYVFRREFLMHYSQLPESPLEKAEKLEQLRILDAGYKIKAAQTEFDSVSIDTEQDVERVIQILRQTSSLS
jgi:3-deoxy-manno-octulosonate cytidylyltransferase (CMP-KDO synthetase)